MRAGRALRVLALLALWNSPALRAQQPVATPDSLAGLDIEELAQIRVTTASRRLEPAGRATAALFVISHEDIRRSGAVSLPEALRLAPGLQLARVTARDWSITARGFAEQSPNKLLVLVDGRAIYSPLFAGVFWDVQDVPLEDVERIEVLLGSGATLWGSNAVNGVINVITRSAAGSHGGLLAVRGGTAEHVAATGRYGVGLGRTGALRVYGRFRDRAPSRLAGAGAGEDDWQQGQGGFRADLTASPRDQITLQGDAYTGSGGQLVIFAQPAPPFAGSALDELEASGGNALARWTHRFGGTDELQLQAYFDRAVRTVLSSFGRVAVNILDLDFQHHIAVSPRHDLLWGLGYRLNADTITGTFTTTLLPSARTTHLITAFVQDEIAIARNRLTATVGAKLERNDLSGAEFQPNLRVLWTPGVRHAVWSAVSRAVRIPSRLDADVRFVSQVLPGSPPAQLVFQGNEDFDSEEMVSWEAGWRGNLHPTFSMDLSLYYSWYDRLRSIAPLPPVVEGGFATQPFEVRNDVEGHAYGGTLAAGWRPSRKLHLRGSYTLLEMGVNLADGAAAGTVSNVNPGFNPRHQAALHSSATLPKGVELDLMLRYVGTLPSPPISDYLQADARVGWAPRPDLSVGVVGRDLLTSRHTEFASAPQREMQRRVEVQFEWRF